ncbi:MAG: RNA polymerase sigma factor [Planctomycetota bacterium]|nr:RNA polymerase sigma factor [Planctomycetota bacterium]
MDKLRRRPNKADRSPANQSEGRSISGDPGGEVGDGAQWVAEKGDKERKSVGTDDVEIALVRRALRGDLDAFEKLISRHRGAVVAQAYALVGDYHVAEDVAQEVFIKVYESLGDIKDPARFKGWLSVIVRHTCVDWARSYRKGDASLEAMKDAGMDVREPVGGEASATIEWREEDGRILAALAEMREDYREIIVMKHMEGMSYKEIAERLDMTVSAVGEKLSRVRGILKTKLEKKGVPRPVEGETMGDGGKGRMS